ncbi:hypothetical protein JNUCC1_02610 [Lentibacillus sp. JNUCC-1]|nr:hypothetical protein [Lentibacillus sp. JNUCC-1]
MPHGLGQPRLTQVGENQDSAALADTMRDVVVASMVLVTAAILVFFFQIEIGVHCKESAAVIK